MSMLRIISVLLVSLCLTACIQHTTPEQYLMQGRSHFQQQDYEKAFPIFESLALQGNPDAMYSVGYLYYYGKGVPQDRILGKYWIKKAAQKGNLLAVRALQDIATAEQTTVQTNTPGNKPWRDNNAPQLEQVLQADTPPAAPVAKATQLFSVQIIAASNLDAVKQFVAEQGLTDVRYETRQRHGQAWYVALYGSFATHQQAAEAISHLPPAVQQLEPWVRQS